MTRDKIIQLYERLEKEKIDVRILSDLKYCTNDEIDMILNNNYPLISINLMINNNFKRLSIETKKKILDLLNNVKNLTIANYFFFVVTDIDLIYQGTVIAAATIISQTEKTYQSLNAANILKNENAIASGVNIELAKIVSETIGEQQCFNVTQVSTSEDVLATGFAVLLTQLVSKSSSNCKADLATSIAKNKTLLEASTELAVAYISKIVNAQNDEEAKLIYSEARKEIDKLKKEYSKKPEDGYIDEFTFWKIYGQNPTKAISLLKENVPVHEAIKIPKKTKRKY